MSGCDCTFAYHSVVAPTHCPKCGRCLGCGQHAPLPYSAPYTVPVAPYSPPSWPYRWPWTSQPSTIIYNTSTAAALQ